MIPSFEGVPVGGWGFYVILVGTVVPILDVIPSDSWLQIKKAYCPPEVAEENPILDYCKHIVFAWYGQVRWEYGGQRMGTVRIECF